MSCKCGNTCAPAGTPASSCTEKDREKCGCAPAPKAALLTGKNFTATRNACKLCAPLGASLAFRGIEGCLPFLHGSQGCSTYIRRYMISHFREPMDIASSNFGEESVVFGGRGNLNEGLKHVIESYTPKVIGIATTCLAETIGDDVHMYVKDFIKNNTGKINLPVLLHASTPSYAGSHADGYQWAVRAIVDQLAVDGPNEKFIGVFPGMVSPADLRHLREIMNDFGMNFSIVPDYSDPLDGPVWGDYHKIPEGGTPVEEISKLGRASAVIELASTISDKQSAATLLDERFSTAVFRVGLPIGIRQSDAFFKVLEQITGHETPAKHEAERGRLIDAYVDGHKYTFGKKVAIYGEEDFVVGLTAFCSEIGLVPVLCASGGKSGKLKSCIQDAAPELDPETAILEGVDFAEIGEAVKTLEPALLIGNSKGFATSRATGVPLIRTGFPIHDRISGPRTLHLGYRGAQRLFDTIVDKLMELKQDSNDIGYTYI
ncbi:nitrogenase component 1 [Pontiella sp.]|uniref:nitrogenase component 1 n=1 Tax=Pontiella sp. TaxID=2837462 RepID=UPI00356460A9